MKTFKYFKKDFHLQVLPRKAFKFSTEYLQILKGSFMRDLLSSPRKTFNLFSAENLQFLKGKYFSLLRKFLKYSMEISNFSISLYLRKILGSILEGLQILYRKSSKEDIKKLFGKTFKFVMRSFKFSKEDL